MTRKLPVAGSIAAAIVLCVAGVAAQGVSQRPYTKADLSGWTGNPGTLTRMIQQIEAKTGGRVVEIRYSSRDAMPGFRAAVAKNGSVTFLSAAAEKGDTVELAAASVPDWMLKWKARADVTQALRATVPLPDAIRAAEQASDGAPAVAAGIASSASNPTSDVQAYNVLIWRHGEVHRVAVDDKSGQVIADPSALADWP
ncbi:MAG TPA: hypothetical protein VK801_01790 [Caulobacteraceae bacterium]|nr:hypothetical protein [Caulobacteraceae bacterium]